MVGFPAVLFICLPVLFICLPGWLLVVGFPAGLSPASFHVFPTSFHLFCTSTSFHLSPSSFHLSPRLGACGFVFHFFSFVSQAGCLWSGSRLACLPLPVICFPLLFTCLPVLFICLPGWVLVVGFPAGLSPTSFHLSLTSFHLSPTCFHLSPSFFNCLPGWVLAVGFPAGLPLPLGWVLVSGRLVSHFLAFVSNVNSLLLGVLNSFLRCVTAGVRPFPLAM